MQMVFHCDLIAWNETGRNPYCGGVISFLLRWSEPLASLRSTCSEGSLACEGLWTAADPWVKSLAVPGSHSVPANNGAEAVGTRLADVGAGFCKLSYSWAWVSKGDRAAKMGMKVSILLPLWERHTQANFCKRGNTLQVKAICLWRI